MIQLQQRILSFEIIYNINWGIENYWLPFLYGDWWIEQKSDERFIDLFWNELKTQKAKMYIFLGCKSLSYLTFPQLLNTKYSLQFLYGYYGEALLLTQIQFSPKQIVQTKFLNCIEMDTIFFQCTVPMNVEISIQSYKLFFKWTFWKSVRSRDLKPNNTSYESGYILVSTERESLWLIHSLLSSSVTFSELHEGLIFIPDSHYYKQGDYVKFDRIPSRNCCYFIFISTLKN